MWNQEARVLLKCELSSARFCSKGHRQGWRHAGVLFAHSTHFQFVSSSTGSLCEFGKTLSRILGSTCILRA